MKEFITPYLGELVSGIIALVLGWFGSSKMTKRQAKSDALSSMQDTYDKFVEDMKQSNEEFRCEIDALKKKQLEIDENWQKKIAAVEKKWQTKYNNLKKEFEAYKKSHP